MMSNSDSKRRRRRNLEGRHTIVLEDLIMDISTDFESGHMLYIFDEVAVLDHILRFADNLFTSSNIYMY